MRARVRARVSNAGDRLKRRGSRPLLLTPHTQTWWTPSPLLTPQPTNADLVDPFTIDEATYPEAQSVALMETRVFLRRSYVQLPLLLELLGDLRGMGPRGDEWAEWGEEAGFGLANGGGGGLLEGEDDGVALSESSGGGIRG